MPNYQEKGGRFQFIPISFTVQNKNGLMPPRAEQPAGYKEASPSCSISKWDVVSDQTLGLKEYYQRTRCVSPIFQIWDAIKYWTLKQHWMHCDLSLMIQDISEFFINSSSPLGTSVFTVPSEAQLYQLKEVSIWQNILTTSFSGIVFLLGRFKWSRNTNQLDAPNPTQSIRLNAQNQNKWTNKK